MNSFFSYLAHVRAELSHVVWPTRKTLISHTLLVIFFSVVFALLITALDYLFSTGLQSIISR